MTHRASALISAQEWFSAGERVGYDAERPGINPRSPLRARSYGALLGRGSRERSCLAGRMVPTVGRRWKLS